MQQTFDVHTCDGATVSCKSSKDPRLRAVIQIWHEDVSVCEALEKDPEYPPEYGYDYEMVNQILCEE